MPANAEPHAQEADWISRVIAHDDHEAFACLVRLHQSPVRQLLRRLTRGDIARADDLAQDVFFKAYRSIASYRGDGRFISWLLTIAYQAFLSDRRRGRKQAFVPLTDKVDEDNAIEHDFRLAVHAFEQLLGELRDSERTALMLHYRYDLNHAEAARAMDVPLGTVKSLIRRARQKLAHLAGHNAL